MQRIYIYHESGTREHYRALIEHEKAYGDISLIFREFSIVRKLLKSILKRDRQLFLKQFVNVGFFIKLFFLSDAKIIVGIAPYDFRLLWLYPLLKRNQYYYHTSKTTWGYVNYSKKFLAKTLLSKKVWTHFVNNSKGVFCVTNVVENEIQRFYNPEHTAVVYHAIDNIYTESMSSEEATSKKIRCLFVGRLEPSKGIELLFQLIISLPSEHFKFIIVGRGSLEEKVRQFAADNPNTFFQGFKKGLELKNTYDQADILLGPSIKTGPWEELFGMVIIEGMARGVVPFTTDHTGPKEIIELGVDGFYYSEREYVERVGVDLQRLILNRKKLRVLQQRAFISGQQYSPEIIYNRWNKLLKNAKVK